MKKQIKLAGDKLSIETPINDFIYYSLRPMEGEVRRGM